MVIFHKPHFFTSAEQTGYDEVTVCRLPTIKRIATIDGDDPVKYSPGDVTRLITAQHAVSMVAVAKSLSRS